MKSTPSILIMLLFIIKFTITHNTTKTHTSDEKKNATGMI